MHEEALVGALNFIDALARRRWRAKFQEPPRLKGELP